MQLIIDIKNENLVDKIVWFLKAFQDKGVEILNYKTKEANENKQNLLDSKWDKEFAKKHWKEIVLDTDLDDMDDDERLYTATARFYNDKYSD
ncbi:MAG: hypothetical protein FAF05_02355 [Epsilonproteobacteria bacterium]|nr:hypothetical protein [Campylobacterota bacterium]